MRLEAVGMRLSLAHLLERGCPPRPNGKPRFVQHDELQLSRHHIVPGLWERGQCAWMMEHSASSRTDRAHAHLHEASPHLRLTTLALSLHSRMLVASGCSHTARAARWHNGQPKLPMEWSRSGAIMSQTQQASGTGPRSRTGAVAAVGEEDDPGKSEGEAHGEDRGEARGEAKEEMPMP